MEDTRPHFRDLAWQAARSIQWTNSAAHRPDRVLRLGRPRRGRLVSSCYGPEEAFLALGAAHAPRSVHGGRHRDHRLRHCSPTTRSSSSFRPGAAATRSRPICSAACGLVSGAALIVDYVLTIAISVASGVDAVFSLLPVAAVLQARRPSWCWSLLLCYLNLRGMQESIKVLLPIFLGFFVTHVVLIVLRHRHAGRQAPDTDPETVSETRQLTQEMGWLFVVSLFLRAYSLGGGTYTGIEAVSNNVHRSPSRASRPASGRCSTWRSRLSFTAGGIILLYLLWNVQPVEGQTLNAVVFRAIIENADWRAPVVQDGLLWIVLALEGGSAVRRRQHRLPRRPGGARQHGGRLLGAASVSYLSTRLVTQNGMLLMGVGASGSSS